EIMDMSFAIQALSVEHIVKNRDTLAPGVHSVPRAIDEMVAWAALEANGVDVDRLTDAQCAYLASWKEGT
ncbi:MAG: adenosylhomocysteinase, partial [Thermoplasmata archaeon]|nr:adenosylhomocysteinase [Thermoplasmata archaeon]